MFLDHGAAFFDHADYLVARVATLVASIGGVLLAIRALVQNLAAARIVGEIEDEHAQEPMPSSVKKIRALTAMRDAGLTNDPGLKQLASVSAEKYGFTNQLRGFWSEYGRLSAKSKFGELSSQKAGAAGDGTFKFGNPVDWVIDGATGYKSIKGALGILNDPQFQDQRKTTSGKEWSIDLSKGRSLGEELILLRNKGYSNEETSEIINVSHRMVSRNLENTLIELNPALGHAGNSISLNQAVARMGTLIDTNSLESLFYKDGDTSKPNKFFVTKFSENAYNPKYEGGYETGTSLRSTRDRAESIRASMRNAGYSDELISRAMQDTGGTIKGLNALESKLTSSLSSNKAEDNAPAGPASLAKPKANSGASFTPPAAFGASFGESGIDLSGKRKKRFGR